MTEYPLAPDVLPMPMAMLRAVTLRLRARRFFCDDTGSAARSSVEQVAGLAVRWARPQSR
jgi:hypothetical protein